MQAWLHFSLPSPCKLRPPIRLRRHSPRPMCACPPAEMLLRVAHSQKDIDSDNKHVLHLQALARKEKDVIKLTCINDKLVQIKAQMNLFDNANLALDGAINNTDDTPRALFGDI